MSGSSIKARDRRALLIGFVVIAGSVLMARGLPALRLAEADLRDRVLVTARAADALEREEALLRQSLVGSRARDERDVRRILDYGFAGYSPTEVSAMAAQYALGVARVHGADVHSVAPASDSAFSDGTLPIDVHVHLTADAEGLFALLDELSSGPRMAAPRFVQLSLVNPSAAEGEPDVLRVELGFRALGRRLHAADR